MTAIMTRADAKAAGLKTYWNGKACPKGHVGGRLTSNIQCVECRNAYGEATRERTISRLRAFRSTPAGKANTRRNNLKKYGIEPSFLERVMDRQLHLCAICGKPNTHTRGPNLVVDHVHASGKVRGFLCHHCNSGLGHFLDNPDTLRKAADYIEADREHKRLAPLLGLTIPTIN